MVKVLIAPIRSLTGDSGAELLMVGAPEAAPTVHVHTFWSVPLLLFTRAVTFQVPADALALVQFAVVTPVLVLLSSVPLRYQLTFTVWSTVILNVLDAVSYTHLRAHETRHDLVCRLLLEKKKQISPHSPIRT